MGGSPIISKERHTLSDFNTNQNAAFKKLRAFFKLYWMMVTIIYLGVSFDTGRWGITWLIWLIAVAVKEAIILFTGAEDYEE